MRLGAIVLAGGRSKRMGRAKELLPFGDTTLLGHVVQAALGAASPVLVVAREPEQLLPELPAGIEVLFDERPDEGPLRALVRGLERLRDGHGFGADDAAFATACDTPFVTTEHVRWLAAQLGDAPLVMPEALGTVHPLCAIYRLAVLPFALARLEAGERALWRLAAVPFAVRLTEAVLRGQDPELRFLRNVNTPENYETIRPAD